QLMRSWMTAMPGELLQCNGCHETQNTTPPIISQTIALHKEPAAIKPYYDGVNLISENEEDRKVPVLGFSFAREVQPVLDKYCVSCHDGSHEKDVKTAIVQETSVGTALDGKPFPISLRGDVMIKGWSSDISGNVGYIPNVGGKFSVAYDNLQRFVRRSGIESDYEMFVPMEYAANTTELYQILKNGHYGVELDPQSWEKIVTWIDMNTPYHGSWSEILGKQRVEHIAKRRLDLLDLYGGAIVDFEDIVDTGVSVEGKANTGEKIEKNNGKIPTPGANESSKVKCKVDTASAKIGETKTIDLGDGEKIELVRIPAGEFTDANGTVHKIEKPFWMGKLELTNKQYRSFDPKHDSRHESRMGYQFGRRGYDMNGDEMPVVRLNWNEATDFCNWLSKKSGLKVDLPTEQQWEFAARAGSETPFWFGGLDTDFTKFANMGDVNLKEFVACTADGNYTNARIIPNPNPFDDRFPKDERFDDGHFLSTSPGEYAANPFGLYDMNGNVSEWTRSATSGGEKVVRGGSWYDRPYRCTNDYRISYPAYQPVFNVGIRVVVED
ncbi:MAG: SUMF1/EgtB/PvdO family nonheme iron enzyme, partial [Thermoguttaceae bacterium]